MTWFSVSILNPWLLGTVVFTATFSLIVADVDRRGEARIKGRRGQHEQVGPMYPLKNKVVIIYV